MSICLARGRAFLDRRDVIWLRDAIDERRLVQLSVDMGVVRRAHFDGRDGHVVRCTGCDDERVDVGQFVLFVLVACRRLVAVFPLRADNTLDEVCRDVLKRRVRLLRRVPVALVATSGQLRREQVARSTRTIRRKVEAYIPAQIPRRQRHRTRITAHEYLPPINKALR